ncbi:MAG: carbohydrate ABC transporter permease [Armatimonadetes bacterium]|nr:carbohydrate ABC transporter permease [Anaerolineae bacterium]
MTNTKPLTPFIIARESTYYTLLSLLAVIMVLPFLWSVGSSFKPDNELFSDTIRLLPQNPTFEHYINAFTTVPFGRYFSNSLFLAIIGVMSNLFFGSLAGYSYARLRFTHKQTFFRLQLTSLMVPGVVTIIPTYIILRSFPLAGGNDILGQGGTGFLNSYWAIFLPGAAGTFAVFLMRQFFLTLPGELGEAARIDGCSEFGIFWRIYLPLCRPALATLAMFTFQGGWNAFLWPVIVLSDPDMWTVQQGLQSFSFNNQTAYGPLMAASVVATLPMLILFLFAQRYFTQGIAFTGTK